MSLNLNMKLNEFLLEKKSQILSRWFERIINNFPSDAFPFLKNQKDPFLNPIGNTISNGIECVFSELMNESDIEKFYPHLNDIMKIMAIQSLPPSKAASLMLLLKKVLQEVAGTEFEKNVTGRAALEDRIEELTLLSFDIYTKCREQIYEIKVEEAKRRTFRLLQKANLTCELSEEGLSSDTV
jgi:hypothetical protein